MNNAMPVTRGGWRGARASITQNENRTVASFMGTGPSLSAWDMSTARLVHEKTLIPKLEAKSDIWTVSLQITISPAEGAVCGYIQLSWNFFVMYFISMKFKKYEREKKKKRGKKGSEFNISFSFNFTASGCVIFIITESEICNAYVE